MPHLPTAEMLAGTHSQPASVYSLQMGEGFSLLDVGKLSEPATALINRVSDAIGGIFKPLQIKRVAGAEAVAERLRAKAEAEAELVRMEGQIQLTELHRRAVRRWVEEEAKKQQNMEAIISKALPQLDDHSDPSTLTDDWLMNFFDKARLVSDEEMQELWAKILAAEATQPGRFSKRAVSAVASLEKSDAVLFSKLCGFVWVGHTLMSPLVYDTGAQIYSDNGVTFASLVHLDAIGLITFDPSTTFGTRFNEPPALCYFGEQYQLQLPANVEFLETGRVILAQTGIQFARVCGAQPVEGFTEYVLAHWRGRNVVASSPWPHRPQPAMCFTPPSL